MSELIEKAELYVLNFLNKNLNKNYIYHNISHTQRVVGKTNEICESIEVSEEDKNKVLIAAWFHDIGFIHGAEDHEEESVKIATKWLKENKVSDEDIEVISNIILATKMGATPNSLLEKIIIDADCAHLASKKFFDYAALLRKEWELTGAKKFSDEGWIKENIHFFTDTQKFPHESISQIKIKPY